MGQSYQRHPSGTNPLPLQAYLHEESTFTVCNVALDFVVSNMFGKSASAITDYLTSDVEFDAPALRFPFAAFSQEKGGNCLDAVEGYEIFLEQKIRIGIVFDHLYYIDGW